MKESDMQIIILNQDKWMEEVLKNKEPYSKDFLGLDITVFPDVFPPCGDSRLLAESLVIKAGAKVLDMCSGSGVQSIFALKKGAGSVVAVDINPDAIANIRYNAEKFSFSDKIDVQEGNLFTPVNNKKFDVIIFNPPFMDMAPSNMFERAVRDKGLTATRNFFREVKNYLNKDGSIFMVFSNWGNFELIKELSSQNNLVIEKIAERTKGIEKYQAYRFYASK